MQSSGPLTEPRNYSFGIDCGSDRTSASVSVTRSADQNTFLSSDGLVRITVFQFIPGRDQVLVAGGPGYIKLHVENNGPQELYLWMTVVDHEGDNPGYPGRQFDLLSGTLSGFGPGANQDHTFGFSTVRSPQSVPWVRVTGYYGSGTHGYPNLPGDWAITIRVGWRTT